MSMRVQSYSHIDTTWMNIQCICVALWIYIKCMLMCRSPFRFSIELCLFDSFVYMEYVLTHTHTQTDKYARTHIPKYIYLFWLCHTCIVYTEPSYTEKIKAFSISPFMSFGTRFSYTYNSLLVSIFSLGYVLHSQKRDERKQHLNHFS